jgi:pimeloyl-ACP methyl ester carboxylesterase
MAPALVCLIVGGCASVAQPSVPAAHTGAPNLGSPTAAAPSSPAPGSPAPTGLDTDVDIGDRTLHLECVGPTGIDEPVILLEAGLGDGARSWRPVVARMDAAHRLCAYDRAGLGESDPVNQRSLAALDHVADLQALLDAADIDRPIVLGAHSYGAEVAILFAQAHPDDVAGLLLVDPRSPRTSSRWRAELPDEADNEPEGLRQLRYSLGEMETDPLLNREHLDLRKSFEQAAAALDAPGPLFGNRPVVVLSAGVLPGTELGLPPDLAATIDGIWRASHQELADESTEGSLEVVPDSRHYIQRERPRVVIDGFERVLADLATP